MTHQDYVSRSRAPKKKANGKKNQAAPEKTGMSTQFKLVLTIAILGVAGFGYMLWSIKDIEPDTAPKAPNKTVEKKSDLPKPPEEKWRYMEELKSKEVEVGQYEVKDKGPWKMQCGSFRSRQQAEKMKATIAFSGLSSTISKSNGSNGTWFKVALGPYEKKREAEKDKHKLRNNNISTCQIWLWQ